MVKYLGKEIVSNLSFMFALNGWQSSSRNMLEATQNRLLKIQATTTCETPSERIHRFVDPASSAWNRLGEVEATVLTPFPWRNKLLPSRDFRSMLVLRVTARRTSGTRIANRLTCVSSGGMGEVLRQKLPVRESSILMLALGRRVSSAAELCHVSCSNVRTRPGLAESQHSGTERHHGRL